jgi:hypothetical protein
MELIIHSYIGQAPIYSKELHCHIYHTSDYEVPEFISFEELQRQREKFAKHYENAKLRQAFTAHRMETKDMLVKWFTENGPATAVVISRYTDKSSQAIHNALRWHGTVFVRLGVADDGYRSAIYGLAGQTLQDMTINCDSERLYHRLVKYLAEHGTGKVPGIALALCVTENRVGSCLSSYRDVFENQKIGRHEFVWRLKANGRS